MSHVIKIAVLSVVALTGLGAAVPTPAAAASPMLVQSRMQQMMDRSARRQARLREERRYAEEEARLAAEAEAEAQRRAQAEAQAAAQAQATPITAAPETKDADSGDAVDEAEVPAPQV